MRITISYTDTFDRQFKRYSKKFQSLKDDLKRFINELASENSVNLGGGFYKYRLSVKSKNRGKGGGFRVITFELLVSEEEKNITFLTIYDKSEQSSLTKSQITDILKKEGLL